MSHLDQAAEKISEYIKKAIDDVREKSALGGGTETHRQAEMAWVRHQAQHTAIHTQVDRAFFIDGYVACALQAAEAA